MPLNNLIRIQIVCFTSLKKHISTREVDLNQFLHAFINKLLKLKI